MDAATAQAICGEVAAVAFARAYGRNPTVAEALDIARRNGRWDANTGMHGPPSEKALLDDMGIPNRLEPNPSQDAVLRDLDNGNPVILSSPGHYHYFVVTGYQRQPDGSVLFDTGNTGMVFKQNPHRYWGWDEIGPQAALFMQEPSAQGPSTATDMSPQQGTAASATDPNPYGQMARDAATKYGVPPDLLRAQLSWESGGFDPDVISGKRTSSAGAIGLGQFMPATAAAYGVDPTDPRSSADGAARYMADLFKQYDDWDLALIAYNGGDGAVRAYQSGQPYAETQAYLKNIHALRTGDTAASAGGYVAPSSTTAGYQPQFDTTRSVGGNTSPVENSTPPVDTSTNTVDDPWAPVNATLDRVRTGIADLNRGATDTLNAASDTGVGLLNTVGGRLIDPNTYAQSAGRARDIWDTAANASATINRAVADAPATAASLARPFMLLPENYQQPFGDPAMERMAVQSAGPNPTHDDLVNARMALATGMSTFGAADVGAGGVAGTLLHGAEEGRALLGAKDAYDAARMYHGTGAAFDTPNPATFDPNGLFGPGYYITSDTRVAESYANTRGPLQDWQHAQELARDEIATLQQRIANRDPESIIAKQATERIAALQETLNAAPASGPNVRAVDVPAGLRLLDVEAPVAADDIARANRAVHAYGGTPLRIEPGQLDGQELRDYVARTTGYDMVNDALAAQGYDGIRYAGGKRIPMTDAAGNAIEHTAVVIFPESLPKIRNAISGTAGGVTAEATSRFGPPTLAGDLGRPPTTLAARGVGTVAGGVIGAAAPADTPEERFKHAAIGAGIGFGLDVGAAAVSRGLAARGAGAEAAYLKGMRGTTVAAVRGAEDAKLAAGGGLDVGGKLLTVNEKLFNRFARLWGLGQDARDAIQSLGGSQARVNAILKTELGPILRDVPSLNALNDYLIAKQIPELEANGFKTPRGMTSAQATADLARMKATLGANGFKAVEDAAQRIYAFQDTHLLQRAVDSGLISQDAANAMRAANKAYFPHQVFDREMTRGGQGGAYRDSVSVADSTIKRRQGSELDIRQPLDAIVNRVYALNRVADRNDAANVVIDALDREGVAQRWTSDALPPVGQEKISRLVNGVQEQWIVPTEIAGAVKQMDSQTVSAFERIFGSLNAISRAGYTVLSPAFLARNVTRDIADRFFRRGRLPGPDYARGIFAAITHNANWEAFMREYGGYSGLAERIASRTTVEQLAGKNPITVGRIVKSPFDFMRAVNEVAEMGPKIGDFVHYTKQGMPARRAAIMAREGTVDYWMGGTTAKALNPVVMFLNANMRALYNAAEPLAVGTPKQRIGAALRLSTLAAAGAGVYEWNQHFTYQTGAKQGQPMAPDIPQYDQNVGWAILTGETQNEKGETVPTYIRVPKPTALVPVGMLVDEMLKWQQGRPGQGILPAAGGLVAGISPLNPSDVGGTILPPVIQAPEEVARNYSDFRQAPIEPDKVHRQLPEYREVGGTTETAKAISRTQVPGVGSAAQRIGLSAPQVDYLGHNILGGIYDTATYAADAGLRAVGYAPPKPPTTQAIDVARNPLTRGVFAARGGQEDQNLLVDYQSKRDAAVRAATDALEQTPVYQQADKDTRDKLRLSVQTKVDQQLREQAPAGTLPSFLAPTPPNHPAKYDPRIYDLLARSLPPDQVQRYRDDPYALERDVDAAAQVATDYRATGGKTPRPTREQLQLASLNSQKYYSREYVMWSRDPARRLTDVERRQQIQGAVGVGVAAP